MIQSHSLEPNYSTQQLGRQIQNYDKLQIKMLEDIKLKYEVKMKEQMQIIIKSSDLEIYLTKGSLMTFFLKYSDQYKYNLSRLKSKITSDIKYIQKGQQFIYFSQNTDTIFILENAPQIFKQSSSQYIKKAFMASRATIQSLSIKQYIRQAFYFSQQDKISVSPSALYYLFAVFGLKYLFSGQKGSKKYQSENLNENIKFADLRLNIQNQQLLKISDFFQNNVVSFYDQGSKNDRIELKQTQFQKFKKNQQIFKTAENDLIQIDNTIRTLQRQVNNITNEQLQSLIQQSNISETMKQQKIQNVRTQQIVKTQILNKKLSQQSKKLDAVQKALDGINTPQFIKYLEDNFVKSKSKKGSIVSRKSTQIKSALTLLDSYLDSINIKQQNVIDRYPQIGTFPEAISTQILMVQRTAQIKKQNLKKYLIQVKLNISKLMHKTKFSSNQVQQILAVAMPFIIQQTFQITQKPILQIQILIKKGQFQIKQIQKFGKFQGKIGQILNFLNVQTSKKQAFISKNFQQSFSRLQQLKNKFDQNKYQLSKLGDNIQAIISQILTNNIKRITAQNNKLNKKTSNLLKQIGNQIKQDLKQNQRMISINIQQTNNILKGLDQIFVQIVKIKDNIIQIKNKINQNGQFLRQKIDYLVQKINTISENKYQDQQRGFNTQKNLTSIFQSINQISNNTQAKVSNTLNSLQNILSKVYKSTSIDGQKIILQNQRQINQIRQGKRIIGQQIQKLVGEDYQRQLTAMFSKALGNNFQKTTSLIKVIQQQLMVLNNKQKNDLKTRISNIMSQAQVNVTDLAGIYKNIKSYSDNIKVALQGFQKIKQLSIQSSLNTLINSFRTKIQETNETIKGKFDAQIKKSLSQQKIQDIQKQKVEMLKRNMNFSEKQYDQIKTDFVNKIKNVNTNIKQSFQAKITQIKKNIQNSFIPLQGLDISKYSSEKYKQLIQHLTQGLNILNVNGSSKYPIMQQLKQIENGIQSLVSKINSININNGGQGGSGGGNGDRQLNNQNILLKKKLDQQTQLVNLMMTILSRISSLAYQSLQNQTSYTYDIIEQMFANNYLSQQNFNLILNDLNENYEHNTQRFINILYGRLQKDLTPQIAKKYAIMINQKTNKRQKPPNFSQTLKKRKIVHF